MSKTAIAESFVKHFVASARLQGQSKRQAEKSLSLFVRNNRCGLKESLTLSRALRFLDSRMAHDSNNQLECHVHYLKAFSKWASSRFDFADTLHALKLPFSHRVVRIRRMLLPDEWSVLKDYLATAQYTRFIMHFPPPHVRKLIYATAIQTGLRRRELIALECRNLHIESKDRCYITIAGADTKNREPAKQYLRYDLAGALHLHTVGRPAWDPLFPGLTLGAARMLRHDLAGARRLYESRDPQNARDPDFLKPLDSKGRTLDFHALRHTCGAWLAMAQVYPKTIQRIMRHSTIQMTMDQYGHLFPGDELTAVQKVDIL